MPAMMPPHAWAIMPRPMHRKIVPGIHSASSGQRGEMRRSYTGAKSTTMGGSRPAGGADRDRRADGRRVDGLAGLQIECAARRHEGAHHVLHGHARVDAGGADVSVILRLQDGHAQLLRLLDGSEGAVVHREVAEAAVSVHHDARRTFVEDLYVGVHVQVAVAHHPGIAADLAGAVAEDAPEIVARQQLRQEVGPAGNKP